MKKIRILSLLLALLTVTSLFAACGDVDDTTAADETTEIPETEAPEIEVPDTEEPETDAPATEAPETEAPETEAPAGDAETEAPAGNETEAPAKTDEKGGCGSSVAAVGVALVAALGTCTAFISKKR